MERKRKYGTTGSAAFLIFLFMIIMMNISVTAMAADSGNRTVRVAFPSQGGMGTIGESGDLVGYNYNYLQELAEYAGWNVEYITFEDQTADEGIMSAMEMVLSGEADLIGPMLRSEGTEQMFEFPSISYGTVYTTLCALEKSTLTSVNYTQCSPLRVAVYSGAAERKKEVVAWLDQLKIDYELIQCDTTEDQMAMLEEDKADVLSSITLSFFEGTRAVAEFAPRPYYLVSTKGNKDLIEELEAAIEAMNYTRPHLQDQLQEKFFGDTSGGYILTKEEQECLDAWQNLNVLCASNYVPYGSCSSEGEPQGLLVSILNDFAKENKIEVNYTFCDSGQDMETKWSTGDYDCVIGFPLGSEYCADNGLIQTAPVTSVGMDIFQKQNMTKSYGESTVAIYNALAGMINLSEFKTVLKCSTLEECLDAVKSGKADYGCLNRLSIDYFIYENGTAYVSTPLLGETLDICFAVSNRLDYHILAALNKYLYTLADSTKTAYLSKAGQHEDAQSFHAYVRSHPIQSVVLFSVAGIMLASLFLLYINAKKNKKRNMELQKANEAMKKANAAKSEFLSRMSHDIRTPLNAILGFAQLGKEDLDAPKALENDLERISSSGEFLLGLVNDVLDMTKIENNAMILKPENYSKTDFRNQLETLATTQCTAKQINLEINLDGSLPDCLYVDKLRFNQIFFNLLSNAIKFTPEYGKVEISGRTLETKGKECRMEFIVQDNGIGMSESFQKVMFDSFSQEHQHISEHEGTGLGLAIVQSLVKLMHGTIQVDSKTGKGSKFIVELTVETGSFEAGEQRKQKMPEGKEISGKRVLLCEDHPVNTQLACRILERAGVQVVCAANGAEGVKLFEESGPGEFNAILMDIRMPVMDGLEATRKIRTLDRADAKTIPIIAMTANAFSEDVQQTKEAGMNAHLCKPIEVESLYETLAALMKDN